MKNICKHMSKEDYLHIDRSLSYGTSLSIPCNLGPVQIATHFLSFLGQRATQTGNTLNPGSVLLVTHLNEPVKIISGSFTAKNVYKENTKGCQVFSNAKWSGEHFQQCCSLSEGKSSVTEDEGKSHHSCIYVPTGLVQILR